MSRNFLSINDELRKGDKLISNNGEWKAVFQDDGNFVVYGWTPKWASDTACENGYRLSMQRDGNLVIYSQRSALWATNTNACNINTCRVELKDDGTLVLSQNGENVWSSATSTGKKCN